ncbi:hypothetical protein OIO90_006390 [Microbotryomycetes sp. JL221]|nr:hypothetical protein OIO90_006390 [Microbotryomycetes sp. JL221]
MASSSSSSSSSSLSNHVSVSVPLLRDVSPTSSATHTPIPTHKARQQQQQHLSSYPRRCFHMLTTKRVVILTLLLLILIITTTTTATRETITRTDVANLVSYLRSHRLTFAPITTTTTTTTNQTDNEKWLTTLRQAGWYMSANATDWTKATQPLPLNDKTTLQHRLQAWKSSPRNEPNDWVAKNLETCPEYRIKPNQNSQMLDKSHMLWASMNSTQVFGLRDEMIHYIQQCQTQGKLSKDQWGKGRGLVFTAGNADTFSRVRLTLRLLRRHLKTNLPAEIFSFPGEVPTEQVRQELIELGATLRTVDDAVRDIGRRKNYHIKSTAIIRSSFQQVLYLDSDNMPAASLEPMDSTTAPILKDSKGKKLKSIEKATNLTLEQWGDPTGLWESKAFKRLGVMFWPDYWRTSADNPIWAIIGVPCRDEWEQEAGQILIDKSKHLDALLLSEWMMDSSRFNFWFNFSDGDKDMFRFAFLALRKRWGLPGRYIGVGALPRNSMTGFCGHTMLQHDHLGRPLFVHANLLKQIPSGIGPGYAWGRTKSFRLTPNSFTLPSFESKQMPEDLIDLDVDADMLTNVQNDGLALNKEASPAIRRRAVIEKGLRPFFHGGWVSALCIDVKWEDPRTGDEIRWAREAAKSVMIKPPAVIEDVDVSYTVSGDGVEIKFEDPLTVENWEQDPRLKQFESTFFNEGGVLSAVGF